MSDPLSISASVAGLIGLATEVTKILKDYVSSVKSAHEDATRLLKEITALCFVLDQLKDLLRKDELQGSFFEKTCVLVSVLGVTSANIEDLYKKNFIVSRFRKTTK
jgi:hypothetical protein